MAGIISKLQKCVTTNTPPPIESNPITQYFEVGKEISTAGPGSVWKVHDAYRKSDGKECSVFVFDTRLAEKLYKTKRKDSMVERLKTCITHLDTWRHPKMLQVIHSLEEGNDTIAFASEPVLSSLHNILAWHEAGVVPGADGVVMPHPSSLSPSSAQQQLQPDGTPVRPPFSREYYFIDMELRYGLLQIIEALQYLHYCVGLIHRNVCPEVILITKRGTWKLFGLEFLEHVVGPDPTDMTSVPLWSIKTSKAAQPCLDYTAPEMQAKGQCNILSDMFSLGLVICALFNNGKPLVQANNNPMLYMKQIEGLEKQVALMIDRVPLGLQEAVERLISLDPAPRATTQLLPLIKYFKSPMEPAIQAMQFLDVITMKDPNQKSHFYRNTLIEVLPAIPTKLRWQHVWPGLQIEVRTAEVLASVLQPIIWLTNNSSSEEVAYYILPTMKILMNSPKSIQASVTILENLHIILSKCERDEINREILPVLFTALDNKTNQIQTASLIAIQNVSDYIEDKPLHTVVLIKVKALLEKNQSDVKIINLILGFFEKILLRLERPHLLELVIPTLLCIRLSDPNVINRVVKLYKSMLMERKFCLTPNVMATKMIPSLAPQTVNPALNVTQFTNLMEIIYDMLEYIDKNQRYKLKMDTLPLASPERQRALRHQMSSDNMNAPPFNIPNLRVERRKTSSAEDMARKNSMTGPTGTSSVGGFKSTGIGQWFFGSNNSSANDGNFLRVASAFPNRRLSDNTLMTPKIRIAPSCASSPGGGGTPGSTAGLPTRRHSSIGPQERRGSAVNLSPPTGNQYRGRGGSGSSLSVPSGSQPVGGSMPNTSSSVPFLLTSSMQSIRSRRPSACLNNAPGTSLLQQLSSGMVRHLPLGSLTGTQVHVPQPRGPLHSATAAGYSALQHTAMAVRKCPSLNITLTR